MSLSPVSKKRKVSTLINSTKVVRRCLPSAVEEFRNGIPVVDGAPISEPVVIEGLAAGKNWGFSSFRGASSWTQEALNDRFGSVKTSFAFHSQSSHKEVCWESNCDNITLSFSEFFLWLEGGLDLGSIKPATHWGYANYKYVRQLFWGKKSPTTTSSASAAMLDQFLSTIDWSIAGLDRQKGHRTTLWLGSQGACTQCHQDTYGQNLVAQLHGRKRWTLFAPDDRQYLYPTRVPYEESSVFSEVNCVNPDFDAHPLFVSAVPRTTILIPGDVLFVPRHWWHHVENLDLALSCNLWLEHSLDNEERAREAIVRLIFSMASESCPSLPTYEKEPFDHAESLQLLWEALKAKKGPRVSKSKSALYENLIKALTAPEIVSQISRML
eukprot:UC4_evm2s1308